MDRFLLALCACALIATFACDDDEESVVPPVPTPVVSAGIAPIERPGYESISGDEDSGLSPDPLPPERSDRERGGESRSESGTPTLRLRNDGPVAAGDSLDLRGGDTADDGPDDADEEATPPTGGSRPAGASCSEHTDCESGICEGEGCDPDEGRCAASDRMCTFDYVPYCGCDGVTFQASGGCPGARFSARGPCGEPSPRAVGKVTPTEAKACRVDADCFVHFQTTACSLGDPVALNRKHQAIASELYPERRVGDEDCAPPSPQDRADAEERWTVQCLTGVCEIQDLGANL